MPNLLRVPRLNPTLVPTVPVEVDWTHPLAQAVTGLWMPGVSPVNFGSAGGITSSLGGNPGAGMRGPKVSLLRGDTGLYASDLGIGGAAARTVFGVLTWKDDGTSGGIIGPAQEGAHGSDFTITKSSWRDLAFSGFYVDFSFQATVGGGDYLTRFAVSFDGVSLLTGRVRSSRLSNGQIYDFVNTGTSSIISTPDINTFKVGYTSKFGSNTGDIFLVGIAAHEWSDEDYNQWVSEPFAMLRPIQPRRWWISPSGAIRTRPRVMLVV